MPPALPGFYYDAEKKKYFKIQPDHVASHESASKYSKAAVKKEAEEQRARKRRKMLEQRERKMRFIRSKLLENPLGGGWGVTRELGVVRVDSGTMVRAWAQGLQGKRIVDFRRPDEGSGAFVFDVAGGVLTFAETLRGEGDGASFVVFVNISVATLGMGADGVCGLGGMLWPLLVIWEGAVGLSWVRCRVVLFSILR